LLEVVTEPEDSLALDISGAWVSEEK